MTEDGFQVAPIEGGAIFRLARPGKLNALTRPMLLGLAACVDALEAAGARLLVIAGEGERAFCAGTDLDELSAMPDDARLDKSAMARALFARISRSRVLSVAAINGLAFGGGLEIAMACTLRVAAAHATFSLPEVKLGLLPAYGGTQFLPALVGASRALDLMLTGRVLGADEALAIGLVDRVIAEGGDATVDAVALGQEITAFSPEAIDGIRRCVRAFRGEVDDRAIGEANRVADGVASRAGGGVSDAGLAVEDAIVRSVFATGNAREGVAAFLERRPPHFTRGA